MYYPRRGQTPTPDCRGLIELVQYLVISDEGPHPVSVATYGKRCFIDVYHIDFPDVLFDFPVRGSQLVCDPLGQVVDCLVGHRLIELPLKEVNLFSIGNPPIESSEGGLGQNIRPKPSDSRTVFIGAVTSFLHEQW